MSIPFLQVKPSAIKLKVLPTFPAQLFGGTATSITKQNGNYTIDWNLQELHAVPSISSPATSYVGFFDEATGLYARAPASAFGGGGGGGIPEAPIDGNTYGRNN